MSERGNGNYKYQRDDLLPPPSLHNMYLGIQKPLHSFTELSRLLAGIWYFYRGRKILCCSDRNSAAIFFDNRKSYMNFLKQTMEFWLKKQVVLTHMIK